ncbi:cytidine deaminase [Tunturiibacter gelidoferens]|uniref:Cytidine deaminase n=1 Tax=Tunturiibacter lichenicola TaxID=2051959 RepID=A0A7Y9NNI2_9BACT|nr:cytidine deaminase [Edaphobacter lichenicola]NYF52639.1 cytidine deaminase [Edaphobacter lichenicola]
MLSLPAPDSLTHIMSSQPSADALTPAEIASLQQQAAAVAHHAYAPYSNFRVGAALLLTDGTIVTGCNVENASYRLTTCAEQTAITSAVALRGPGIRIRAIAVANLNATASQPCGACRQTIYEFSTPDTIVFFPAEAGSIAHATIAELLPAAFLL